MMGYAGVFLSRLKSVIVLDGYIKLACMQNISYISF
jgi:hypothetical protein